jgi:hypothetical protein
MNKHEMEALFMKELGWERAGDFIYDYRCLICRKERLSIKDEPDVGDPVFRKASRIGWTSA